MADEFELDTDDLQRRMDGAIHALRTEFASLRTGRASGSMLEPISVDAYGQMTPINQLGTINVPEPRMVTINVWDKGMVGKVEKAIRESELGLDPAHQGGVIRVPLPSMNEQRRKELVKVLSKLAEDGRIAIRHARTDARDKVKKLDGVSEDDKKHAEKELQKAHDDGIGKLDVLLKTKEAEIMEV